MMLHGRCMQLRPVQSGILFLLVNIDTNAVSACTSSRRFPGQSTPVLDVLRGTFDIESDCFIGEDADTIFSLMSTTFKRSEMQALETVRLNSECTNSSTEVFMSIRQITGDALNMLIQKENHGIVEIHFDRFMNGCTGVLQCALFQTLMKVFASPDVGLKNPAGAACSCCCCSTTCIHHLSPSLTH